MADVKLEKISREASVLGESKIELGWYNERWSDGTHKFLLQYSPEDCSVYPPRGFTSQTVVDVAVANGIDYNLVPIIDGEVVTVDCDQSEILMQAVYDAIIALP